MHVDLAVPNVAIISMYKCTCVSVISLNKYICLVYICAIISAIIFRQHKLLLFAFVAVITNMRLFVSRQVHSVCTAG